ncbi:MAG: SemiSWEET transporter [Saprospiraceae bacterium]|nr:SemiSWEET transporter [Saprospiraceae bacterium]
MNTVALIGFISAFLTTGAFVPQALKTIKSRSTADLSLGTFSMMFAGTIMWFIYGLHINDTPMIIANAITSCLTGIILGLKIYSIIGEKRINRNYRL